MDSIVLASDSLVALGSVMDVMLSMACVLLSAMGATTLAMKMSPLSPSDELSPSVDSFHSTASAARYAATQLRLMEIHAKRQAILSMGEASTRAVHSIANYDDTQINPIRTMVVS